MRSKESLKRLKVLSSKPFEQITNPQVFLKLVVEIFSKTVLATLLGTTINTKSTSLSNSVPALIFLCNFQVKIQHPL